MNTAELLSLHDRCPRSSSWGEKWEVNRLHPNEALRLALDAGLMANDEDPGQFAGDTVMTLAAERGLDTDHPYDCAMHNAALSDLIVTVLRTGAAPFERPEDRTIETSTWESSCFVEPSGLRLRRIVLVDRWSKDREESEGHSWKTLGECAVYELPMTMTVVLVGQRRNERRASPWSKGFLHPRSRNLRIRKRDGESFGGDWKPVWREECDNISRDKWIDQMHADGVMQDVCFEVDVPAPCPELSSKIRQLAERKLSEIRNSVEIPDVRLSVCHWPTPCSFVNCCWTFQLPSQKLGFNPLK